MTLAIAAFLLEEGPGEDEHDAALDQEEAEPAEIVDDLLIAYDRPHYYPNDRIEKVIAFLNRSGVFGDRARRIIQAAKPLVDELRAAERLRLKAFAVEHARCCGGTGIISRGGGFYDFCPPS